MSKKKIPIPPERLSEETQLLCDVLNDESDLACIVIGAAFLDSALKSLLDSVLQVPEVAHKLLERTQPLGTYGARTDLAYCLGVVSKHVHQDLKTIGKIRNHVAHHRLAVTFGEAPICDFCDNLNGWRIMLKPAGANFLPPGLASGRSRESSRMKFNTSVILVANRLIIATLGEKQ